MTEPAETDDEDIAAGPDPLDEEEPYDWRLLIMSIAVFLGSIVFLAGASSLLAAIFFPGVAFTDGPLAGRSRTVQVLASLGVLLAGALLAGVPLARSTMELYRVRKRDDDAADET